MKYGDYYSQTADQRKSMQTLMYLNAIATVKRHHPTAVSFDLSTSDQGNYGFVLGAVTLADGTEADYTDALDEDIYEHLCDADWNGIFGEDKAGYVTIPVPDDFPTEITPEFIGKLIDEMIAARPETMTNQMTDTGATT